MRLFFKEHIGLIITQIVQFIIIASLFWLAGYHDIKLILYAFLLSGLTFIGYLTFYYFTRRKYYQRIATPITSLDESLQALDDRPASEALSELLKSQYYLYKQQLHDLERKQDEHLVFMDRWIHQMKTPLSVIELMATDLDEPLSSNMREETERMKTGLNTVLYMARLRTIEQDFHIKQVDVVKLIHEVNQEHKRFYIRNKVYPVVETEAEMIVETDEKWLYFIITQLIQNAVKYSTNQANEVKITLSKTDAGQMIEVRDFGVGIPKEDLPRVFDAFYTGENGRVFRESTGMGLFLVKEVADYLGHQVSIESTVDEGSNFRVIF